MRTTYRIVARGEPDGILARAFRDLRPERDSGRTILSANLDDPAQLRLILERLRDFGIELLPVRSQTADPASERQRAETRLG